MLKLRRQLVLGAVAATLVLGNATAQAADPDKKNLVFGATAGYNYDVLKLAIVPQLEKDGYKVKLVEFNDYVQPNRALAQGSLDANLFQHIAYLNRFKTDQKLDLIDLVQSTTAPMGVYSKTRTSFADLQDGDRFTLPNDPSNLARALQLLQPVPKTFISIINNLFIMFPIIVVRKTTIIQYIKKELVQQQFSFLHIHCPTNSLKSS